MYKRKQENEDKRIKFFEDLNSSVKQMKLLNVATSHDLNIINDFAEGSITFESMKFHLKCSEEATLRRRDRLNEILYSGKLSPDWIRQLKLEIKVASRAPSEITQPIKESFESFISFKLSYTDLIKVVESEINKRNELIKNIEVSYDKNITQPSLAKINTLRGNYEMAMQCKFINFLNVSLCKPII